MEKIQKIRYLNYVRKRIGQNLWHQWKDFVTGNANMKYKSLTFLGSRKVLVKRNNHVKYENPIFNSSWIISKIKVFVHADTNTSLPGTLVPKATNDMAVTASFSPIVQPKLEARSPKNAVNNPMPRIDTTKQAQPPR